MKLPSGLLTPGARLRWARQQKKFPTMRSVAAAAGWDYETYKKAESDERQLDDWSKAVRYATFLGISPVWLLGGTDALGVQLAPEEAELVDRYRAATDEGRRALLAVAEAMSKSADPFRKAS